MALIVFAGLALMGSYAWGVRSAKENMMTVRRNRTKRITTRKVGRGYRVTGQKRIYRTMDSAFDAAWKVCARTGADLYRMDPNGKCVLSVPFTMIESYEHDRT